MCHVFEIVVLFLNFFINYMTNVSHRDAKILNILLYTYINLLEIVQIPWGEVIGVDYSFY